MRHEYGIDNQIVNIIIIVTVVVIVIVCQPTT
jgi:phage shock protein PspC (stress-responsive transcriptional regulator)